MARTRIELEQHDPAPSAVDLEAQRVDALGRRETWWLVGGLVAGLLMTVLAAVSR